MANQIEGKCACPDDIVCEFIEGRWQRDSGTCYYCVSRFCRECGYALGKDGIARPTAIVEDALPTIDEMKGILAGEADDGESD